MPTITAGLRAALKRVAVSRAASAVLRSSERANSSVPSQARIDSGTSIVALDHVAMDLEVAGALLAPDRAHAP